MSDVFIVLFISLPHFHYLRVLALLKFRLAHSKLEQYASYQGSIQILSRRRHAPNKLCALPYSRKFRGVEFSQKGNLQKFRSLISADGRSRTAPSTWLTPPLTACARGLDPAEMFVEDQLQECLCYSILKRLAILPSFLIHVALFL